MTTINFIDPSLHGSAMPATYVPSGALQALGVTPGGAIASTTYTTNGNMTQGTYAGDSGVVILGNTIQDDGDDSLSGYFTGTGNICVIPLGFEPTYIKAILLTGTIADSYIYEWYRGLPSGDVIITYCATPTIIPTGSSTTIVPSEPSPGGAASGPAGNWIVTLNATVNGTGTVIFRIEG